MRVVHRAVIPEHGGLMVSSLAVQVLMGYPVPAGAVPTIETNCHELAGAAL